jgi:hypothetical protein
MRRVSKKRQAKAKSDEGRAEQAYMLAVKRLPCCICGAPPPSDAHHTICGRYGSRKTSAYETIPLCKAHHQDGPDAIHNGKASWVAKYGPDTDYIAPTQKILRGEPL